jgi:hypothetical protein
MFAAVAPKMISEASASDVRAALRTFALRRALDGFIKGLKGKHLDRFEFNDDEIETCILQFRALAARGEAPTF